MSNEIIINNEETNLQWRNKINQKFAESVSVQDYGAVGDGITDDTAAIQEALDSLDGIGGTVFMPDRLYMCSTGLKIPNGVILQGNGIGEWDVIFHSRPKGWTGTSILFSGTGTKSESFDGITNLKNTGGWRVDEGDTYKLLNLMNTNAVGTTKATPISFSAAISPKQSASGLDHGYHWGLKDIRIVPWMGVDGYTDYSNESNTSLGADWDVGLLSNDSEYEMIDNVQVVGYWRIAGTMRIQPGYSQESAGERGYYKNLKTQGYRGLVLRAGDIYPVTAATTTTIEIPWSESHYFDTTGTIEASGGVDYAYTGLSFATDKLTFTGVTPDSSSLPGSTIRNFKRGTGVAGTIFESSTISGLSHVSGDLATDLGFAEAAPAFEISGYPLRGYEFINTKIQNSNSEPINTIFGECEDVFMFGCQMETGVVIAAPLMSDQSWATYPGSVESIDLRLYGHKWSTNKTLFTPRVYFDDGEVFNPIDSYESRDILNTQSGKEKVIRKASGQNLIIEDEDGTDLLILYDDGDFSPGLTNTKSFGTLDKRWGDVFSREFHPGAGVVTWTSDVGSPNGALVADIGSMYTQTNGGPGSTLWVKEADNGASTGWVAK